MWSGKTLNVNHTNGMTTEPQVDSTRGESGLVKRTLQ